MTISVPLAAADPSAQHRDRHRARLSRLDPGPVQVLIANADRAVTEIIATALRYECAEVTSAGDGATAVAIARDRRPDIALVDPRLPDMNGSRVIHELRHHRRDMPLLILTPPKTVPVRIAGVTAGGDDWLTKPFSMEVLVTKLRTLLRHSGARLLNESPEVRVGDLILNEDSREVSRGGVAIHMSSTEFELMRFLMLNAHRVVTKPQILSRVWPYDYAGRLTVVELYVSYLRKKIDAGRAPMIHTLRGVGYILKATTPYR